MVFIVMNMLLVDNQFNKKELSKDFILDYMNRVKIDKALSSFYSLKTTDIPNDVFRILKDNFGFMEIFFNSIIGQYNPLFTRSLINFVKSEIDAPSNHSYVRSFGDCMWESASLLFNNPFDYQVDNISNSLSKLKYAFDLFGSGIVFDLKELIDLEYDVNEGYNLDYVIDIFYSNTCPGYRDAFIVNDDSNKLTDEQINVLSGLLLGDDMLGGEFKVEVILIEYKGIDDFISRHKGDYSQLDSFLEALSELIKYSCPGYINISKPKVVSTDDLSKLGYDSAPAGDKIAFIAFSDSYEESEKEMDIDCKMKELYGIWNAYMNIERFLER